MDTQSALANAGVPFEIDWKGGKVKILYRVQRIKARFERWAKDRAISELLSLKPLLSPEDYRDRMREKLNEFEGIGPDGKPCSTYAYDSPRLKALRETEEGKLAHVRTFIDGADGWSQSELEDFLIEHGDLVAAYVSAGSSKVEELLKDLGENPDPKESHRRLQAAGMWE